MSTEEERVALIKAEHDQRLRAAEQELKALREAERKYKEVAKAAHATAKAAQEAEKVARAEVEAQRNAAREAAAAERAAQEQAQRYREEVEALRSDQATARPTPDDLMDVSAADSTVLLNVVQNMQQTFERSLQAVVAQVHPTGGPARVNRDDRNLYLSAIKQKMRALNTKAADMSQELESFFLPIDSYIEAAGDSFAPPAELEKSRVSLLHNMLGDAARNAMKGTPVEKKATYALYKEAIRARFLVECDPCHLTQLLRSAAMGPSETTKEYVTRLWALVSRIPDLTLDLQQREILTSLRMGHSNLQLRNLLMEKQPKTVPDAERICEEFESRERMAPVSTKFAAAMASANPAVPVDNVQQGGYHGPKHKNRGGQGKQKRDGANSNKSSGSQKNAGQSLCHRCQRPGHIAKYCLASAPAVLPPQQNRASGQGQSGASNSRQQSRPVMNISTAPSYSDYAATQEHRQMLWPQSNVPLSGYTEYAADAAYEGGYEQGEVLSGHDVFHRLSQGVGLSYGYGSPQRHRRPPPPGLHTSTHHINEVSDTLSEWWV